MFLGLRLFNDEMKAARIIVLASQKATSREGNHTGVAEQLMYSMV